MTEEPSGPPHSGGDGGRDDSLLGRLSLKPAYKKDDPNPHAHSRGFGRSQLPTPSTVAGHIWRSIGIESHVALTVFLVPLLSVVVYLYTAGMETEWLGVFLASVVLSYAIYYGRAPREAKHVIARLENIYHAKRFALVSSGIATLSILSTLTVVGLLASEEHFAVKASPTSITIATFGLAVGLLSSYVLVRVLVARALPVTSDKPYLDRVVEQNPLIEIAFILAALGAPLFIFAAQFLWDRPSLIRFEVTLTRHAAALLLMGFTCIYTSLVTRL